MVAPPLSGREYFDRLEVSSCVPQLSLILELRSIKIISMTLMKISLAKFGNLMMSLGTVG